MITNLLAVATITLLTNVVQTDNAEWGQHPYIMFPEGGGPKICTKAATERYVTVNIIEHTQIVVSLPSGPETFYVDRTISSVTTVYRAKEPEWQQAGVKTNALSLDLSKYQLPVYTTYTNIILTNNLLIKPD